MAITGLVGHWPLQDNLADNYIASLVGPTGTISGGYNSNQLTTGGPGATLPRSLAFNGTGGAFVDIPTLDYLSGWNKLSVTAFVRLPLSSPVSGHRLVYISDGDSLFNPRLDISLGNVTVTGAQVNLSVEDSGSFDKSFTSDRKSFTGWRLWATTVDFTNSTVNRYLDGVLVNQTTGLLTAPSFPNAPSLQFNIGAKALTAGPASGGIFSPVYSTLHIADVRLYNTILPGYAIADIYNNTGDINRLLMQTTMESNSYLGTSLNSLVRTLMSGKIESTSDISARMTLDLNLRAVISSSSDIIVTPEIQNRLAALIESRTALFGGTVNRIHLDGTVGSQSEINGSMNVTLNMSALISILSAISGNIRLDSLTGNPETDEVEFSVYITMNSIVSPALYINQNKFLE